MTRILHHVAVAVWDTDVALEWFRGSLGLAVVGVDEPETVPVRLTYLAAGGALLQLVQPLHREAAVHQWLSERGEGLHHICFSADDVTQSCLDVVGRPPDSIGSGLGVPSAFLPGVAPHGVLIEFTQALPTSVMPNDAAW